MNDIKEICEKYKPKVLVINELNFNHDDDDDVVKINGYEF